ncbi:unnamed protein product [Trichobilharzia regenti]|nr:unnamed protein product [Trichobilharzia regenti]
MSTVEAKSDPLTSKEKRVIHQLSTVDNNTTIRSQSIAALHANTKSSDEATMIKRLRKLSVSYISNKSHHVAASSSNNNSSNSKSKSISGSSTTFRHIKHSNSKSVKLISNQKTANWDSEGVLLSDRIDEGNIPGSGSHTLQAGLISHEDMGDFLSHVVIEEEAVDPDLDLDFDSVAHESSGMQSSLESPIQLESLTDDINLDGKIEFIDETCLLANNDANEELAVMALSLPSPPPSSSLSSALSPSDQEQPQGTTTTTTTTVTVTTESVDKSC